MIISLKNYNQPSFNGSSQTPQSYCQHFLWNLCQDPDLQFSTLPASLATGRLPACLPAWLCPQLTHHLTCHLSLVTSMITEYLQGLKRSSSWKSVRITKEGSNCLELWIMKPLNGESSYFWILAKSYFTSQFPSRLSGIDIHSNISSWYLVETAFENSTHVY